MAPKGLWPKQSGATRWNKQYSRRRHVALSRHLYTATSGKLKGTTQYNSQEGLYAVTMNFKADVMCKKHLELCVRVPSSELCFDSLKSSWHVWVQQWLHYYYVACHHRHIPGWGEGAGGGFSSCSLCVPLPPWGRSTWGCWRCRAGPAAASGWPQRWCWDGNGSWCTGDTLQSFPAPGRRHAHPTAAALETWRGCDGGAESCRGKHIVCMQVTIDWEGFTFFFQM